MLNPGKGYSEPDYNGEYIPSLSANYYEDSGEIDPDYYENYPNGQYRRRSTKATKRCKDMRTGQLVDCNERSRRPRDQTSWMVEPAGPAGEKAWSVDMVTDERRVEHFATFEKLVFAITYKISRILMEHIESICSLESGLIFMSICSIRILNILEVIAKMSFSKIAKCSTLNKTPI